MLNAVDSFAKLAKLVQNNGLTFYQLGKRLGIPSSFFSEWKRGKMMPKIDKLKILADYFDVPITYFLEE